MFILRGLEEDGAGPAYDFVCSEVVQAGTTNSFGHMDNPPDSFSSICCYLFSAREKHSLLSPYSNTCLAFKHMNSAHRPSVLSKGREREHIPQEFNGLY